MPPVFEVRSESVEIGIADGISDGISDGIADGISDGIADGIADGPSRWAAWAAAIGDGSDATTAWADAFASRRSGRSGAGNASRRRCGRGEPCPGADVGGASPVPAQLQHGRG